MQKDHKKEFIKEWLNQALHSYIQEYVNELIKTGKEFREQIYDETIHFIMQLVNVQKDLEIPIGCITISFMWTSLLDNAPKFRIEALDTDIISGECLYYKEFSANRLFWGFDEFKNQIKQEVDKRHLQRYIREEGIRELSEIAIPYMLVAAISCLKYIFDDLEENAYYEKLKKTERFHISAGQYKDMQKLLFADLKELDIFYNIENESLMFHTFRNKVYRKKKFENMDLTACKFIQCEFTDCSFQKTVLNDCLFTDCSLKNIEFCQCSMLGTWMINAESENITYRDCLTQQNEEEIERTGEIYRDGILSDFTAQGDSKAH